MQSAVPCDSQSSKTARKSLDVDESTPVASRNMAATSKEEDKQDVWCGVSASAAVSGLHTRLHTPSHAFGARAIQSSSYS
jgi:hypothetical protein